MRYFISLLFVVILSGTAHASSQASDTTYKFYSLYGKDALDILRSIHSRGPMLHGSNAIAMITPKFEVKGDLVQQGNSCRVQGFDIEHAFKITLPKLKTQNDLEPKVRILWDKFAAHAKWHEEEHRRIWLGCIALGERTVRALRAPSCAKLDEVAAKSLSKIFKDCEAKQVAFDKREEKVIERHALVQQALGEVKKRQQERRAKIEAAPQMPDWFYQVR